MRVEAGDWTERRLPALVVEREGEEDVRAINDLVLVRGGAGQVMVEVEVDGERFIRLAGDGLVAATPLGSTAYTMAAGGPMLAPGALGLVLTPLCVHGGVCPPLVTARASAVRVILEPGHGGARVELDGQVHDKDRAARARDLHAPARAGIRQCSSRSASTSRSSRACAAAGSWMDSPRVLARDDRVAGAPGRPARSRSSGPGSRGSGPSAAGCSLRRAAARRAARSACRPRSRAGRSRCSARSRRGRP